MSHTVLAQEQVAPPTPAAPGRSVARQVTLAAVALVVLQLATRAWAASESWFYYDDLIFTGRGASFPLTSADLLLHDQDGHLMPGGFALAALLTRVWPFEWGPVATSMVVMQALASLAVLYLLRALLGSRPVLLLPLTLYLFTPLTLPGATWWAVALNTLPLQAGLAWFVAATVRLLRTGRARHAVSGVLALAVTAAFSEKVLFVAPLAALVGVLLLRQEGVPSPLRAVLRRARPLWLGSLAVLAVWAVLYVSSIDQVERRPSWLSLVRAVNDGLVRGALPPLVGGPWTWDRVPPGMPYAAPSLLLVGAAIVVLVAAVSWTTRRRRGAVAVWWLAAGYVLLSTAVAARGRVSSDDDTVLGLTLRWFPDSAVVVALAVALLLQLPARSAPDEPRRAPAAAAPGATERLLPDDWPPRVWVREQRARIRRSRALRQLLVTAAATAFVAGSLASTYTFATSGHDDRTRDYVRTATASLAASDAPLLDQEVPADVLGPLTSPNNLASQVFAPLPGPSRFADATDRLQLLDEQGRLVPATVTPVLTVAPGPVPDCGWYTGGGSLEVPLSGNAIGLDWTVQVNYLTDREADVSVALGEGPAVQTRLPAGLQTVYLRLTGPGDRLLVTTRTPGVQMCITSGVLGEVQPG
ncbi:hypothetical protein GB931_06670 [Modestobacter sp. I12A-02628]|uniref:Uncharacterized protein n=1 Tax=Goekera deserti TaxID=2497753 RepID=A0A7K3WB34_9ACTN|nr:hypothetical protein [Goekera deserti]MPQ97607.1 hypothetical protein [Goekera deserti]NDI47789.1 hypothetical protein [Goekera deserti]NEL53537.1 hypothetical protein [Goekera deserti]